VDWQAATIIFIFKYIKIKVTAELVGSFMAYLQTKFLIPG
jgi:hypothetical protein